MQQPPNQYPPYPLQEWPRPPDQNNNYSMPQYQQHLYQIPMQPPMTLQMQKQERPVNKTMKIITIVLFAVAFASAIFGAAYHGLVMLAGILMIIGFVCVFFI